MNDEQSNLLFGSKAIIEFLEIIYTMHVFDQPKVVIDDLEIVEALKAENADSETIIKENKLLYPYYEKKAFCRLLGDFCVFAYESLKNIYEFKPQVAYALARKPFIDNVFYFQMLYDNPNGTVDLIFSDNAKEKDVNSNKKIDEQLSEKITKMLGFDNDMIYDLRYSQNHYSILTNCNKALHITTSRANDVINTKSGELNFVFMQDDEILHYINNYLFTVPMVLLYVAMLVFEIHTKLYGENQILKKRLEELKGFYNPKE